MKFKEFRMLFKFLVCVIGWRLLLFSEEGILRRFRGWRVGKFIDMRFRER